jgi:phage pi2 protein 07
MKILILLILLSSTLFSQKLWEIEVNPNDLLRDVTEIPNSDLLLFTYNTGKLEIRRSGDGSFVNQLIRKPNESGELRISNSGKVYYWLFNIDTIEFRDIATNEVLIKNITRNRRIRRKSYF